jgi:hypothetical protein
MGQLSWKWAWGGAAAICTLLLVSAASAQSRPASAAATTEKLTCDASQINPDSYALTTRVMAQITTEDHLAWWEAFSLVKSVSDLKDRNWSALYAAERAAELDPHNLLAHGVLAKQDVVLGIDAARSQEEWRAVLDNGGAVVWTGTLYDVDIKSFFVLAFDRRALRVYRLGEIAGPFEKHLGMPKFPGPERERLWRAWAGCIDPAARPEATIPWSDVSEIKAGNWVLYFKLARKVTIASDNGKHADLNEIKVNLHGGTPTLEARDPVDPWKMDVRVVGVGPLAFQERVRRTLVALVDPERRIALPKASRSAGW